MSDKSGPYVVIAAIIAVAGTLGGVWLGGRNAEDNTNAQLHDDDIVRMRELRRTSYSDFYQHVIEAELHLQDHVEARKASNFVKMDSTRALLEQDRSELSRTYVGVSFLGSRAALDKALAITNLMEEMIRTVLDAASVEEANQVLMEGLPSVNVTGDEFINQVRAEIAGRANRRLPPTSSAQQPARDCPRHREPTASRRRRPGC